MDRQRELDKLLRNRQTGSCDNRLKDALAFAEAFAQVENVVAVVSDTPNGVSHICNGRFASVLGIEGYSSENSIWEKRILDT